MYDPVVTIYLFAVQFLLLYNMNNTFHVYSNGEKFFPVTGI